MGGESDVLWAIYNGFKFFFTADWVQIKPYMDRILHVVIVFFVLRWWWKRFLK